MNVSPTVPHVLGDEPRLARVTDTSISTYFGNNAIRRASCPDGAARPSPAISPMSTNRSIICQSDRRFYVSR